MRVLLTAAFLIMGLPARASGASAMLCDFQSTEVSNGAFVVQNNEWGSGADECVVTAGGPEFAVAESDIDNQGGSPGAYPSIYTGCHWGQCTSGDLSTDPMPLSSLVPDSVTSSWSTLQPFAGVYDTAYDIWFNHEPTTSGAPDCAELMVWLNHNGPVQPFGSLIAQGVTIDGTTYDVWEGANTNWNTVSYEMTNPVSSVTNLDIASLATDAAQRGFIPPSCYLLDVEAGFELWQDGTGLATTGFSVNVGTPAPSPAPSGSVSPTGSPSPSPSGSPTPSASPSPSASPTTSAPVRPSATPAPSGSPSPSPSASASPGPSPAPSSPASPTTSPSASPTAGPSASCAAKFTVVSAWPGGFWGQITITGAKVSARRPRVEWRLPAADQITELWDGALSQHGTRVVVTRAARRDGVLSVGFIAISSGPTPPAPAHIALDGTGCMGWRFKYPGLFR